MVEASREPEHEAEKDMPELTVFKAAEAVLKGIEVPLPAPHKFYDKDGQERDRVRVRWWDNEAMDYRELRCYLRKSGLDFLKPRFRRMF